MDDSKLTLVKRQRLAFDGAQKKPLRLWGLFREHPFAIDERMFDQQLNRLGNEPLAFGRLGFGKLISLEELQQSLKTMLLAGEDARHTKRK